MLCVLTGKDAAADGIGTLMAPMPEDIGGPKGYRARRPLLAADKVRAVGDRVAFVVAESLRQAQDAAELIEVDYEMLPAVTSVEDAVKPGAPAVWDDNPGNVAFTLAFGNKDATDAAFAKARHTVVAAARKQSPQRQLDRAARRDRRLQRRRRRLHALCDVAEPARQPLAARRPTC